MAKRRTPPPVPAPQAPSPIQWRWWFGVAVAHLIVVLLLGEVFPFVILHVAVLAVLTWLAQRGKCPLELPLCLGFSTCFLLAEPSVGLGGFIVLIMIPAMLLVERVKSPRALSLLGLWCGWVISSGIYAWIFPTVKLFFDDWGLKALPLFLGLTVIVALPIAAFFWILALLARYTGLPAWAAAPFVYTIAENAMPLPMGIPLPLAFAFDAFWIQALDLAGIGGMTFLIVAVASALWVGLDGARHRDGGRLLRGEFAAMLLVVLVGGYGLYRMRHQPAQPPLRVGIIQPVSPLRVTNKEVEVQEQIASRLLAQTVEASSEGPLDLIMWPEGAAAFAASTPSFNPPYMRALMEAQRLTSATLVVHNVDFIIEPGQPTRYRSAISVVEPMAEVTGVFHKQILMPFGEYLPFESTFPFLRSLFPAARNIQTGGKDQPLEVAGVRFAPVICYEVLVAPRVRRLAALDVGFIGVVTNDRWYGQRQQPRQHLAFAVLRAIENRKPVVRGAHSGISALIAADGSIEEMTRVEDVTVLRGAITPRQESTLYQRIGDVFPRIVAPLMLVALIVVFRRRSP